jgi:alpha-galactosidase
MIHFNQTTRIFNLILASSHYIFQVDDQGRLVHLDWGLRPADADAGDMVQCAGPQRTDDSVYSFMTQYRPDEILTFGDVASFHVTLKASFPTLSQPLQPGESPHLPVRDVRLRYISHRISLTAQPGLAPAHGLPVQQPAPRETLRVQLTDPAQPFQVTACYRLTPEHDILERWYELENLGTSPVTLDICQFASLHFPVGTQELTYVSGAWAREFVLERVKLSQGTRLLESRSLQTGHGPNPVFMLNRPGQAWEEIGTVYFGALAYSGSWQMAFEQLPSGDVRLHAGYNPFDFELQLEPGEKHVTPALVCGLSAEGWGGASRRLHAFAQERIVPEPKPRPVLYNSWEATYFDVNHSGQLALARKAAQLGVELFCVDDGWFGARHSDRAGLGDWVVRPDAFPEGLEPLVREVQRLGMKFGLWVEPEMVNPDSDLYRQHPDWVLHLPGRPRTEARHQLILDFGRTEVVDYIFEQLNRLVETYQLDFFKWDMNRLVTEPGSVAGQALWHNHVAAVYRIMDDLRRRHPQLEIQSCSGGGGRIDLGILGRTDQVWVSDNTDALERVRIQEGYSLWYPARCMEAWVTHTHNHLSQRVIPLSLRFDVAMRGVLGIGSNLNELSETELTDYAGYIAFYKLIRPVVQTGRLHRLERLEDFEASVIEYVLADATAAVYSEVVREHRIGAFRPTVPLKGLHSRAHYRVLDWNQQIVHTASGYELMTLGLPPIETEQASFSRTLYLQVIDD